jgi:hypothetical protein
MHEWSNTYVHATGYITSKFRTMNPCMDGLAYAPHP